MGTVTRVTTEAANDQGLTNSCLNVSATASPGVDKGRARHLVLKAKSGRQSDRVHGFIEQAATETSKAFVWEAADQRDQDTGLPLFLRFSLVSCLCW